MKRILLALTAVKKALNREWGGDTCENDLKHEIDLLTALVTPPTADEVCEEIEIYFYQCVGKANPYVKYQKDLKKFVYVTDEFDHEVVGIDSHGYINFMTSLPPYLILLIARFYEGVE
jgi:hypothetical protein